MSDSNESRIMERFNEIMADFDKHPYARLMERNVALEACIREQRELLDECERALEALCKLYEDQKNIRLYDDSWEGWEFCATDMKKEAFKTLAKLRAQERG